MPINEADIARFRYRAQKELELSVLAKRAGESPITEWWAEIVLRLIEYNDELSTDCANSKSKIAKLEEDCRRHKAQADAMQHALVGKYFTESPTK